MNNFIYIIYDNRFILLLISSIVFLIFYFFNNRKKIFKELEDEQYQSKEYHKNLVKFLNDDSYNESNIFWLNGSWGSGKTRFINVFFENQNFDHNNIYKISCFGLKTREQLERNLREQIENKSTFYFLQTFPLIGGLLSYISQEVGLKKIKKRSIIIFDDLERVAVFLNQKQFIYVNGRYELIEEEDKETIDAYNNIMGYIDYLAEEFPVKIIVLYNMNEIPKTKALWSKFKTNFNDFDNRSEILEDILTKAFPDKENNMYNFLKNYYMFILLVTNSSNYRSVKNDIYSLKKTSKIKDYINNMLNNNKKILTKWPDNRNESKSYSFFSIDDRRYDGPDLISEEEKKELAKEINKKQHYYIKVFESLWNWVDKDGKKIFPQITLELNDREDYFRLDETSDYYEKQKIDNKLEYKFEIRECELKENEKKLINLQFDKLNKAYDLSGEIDSKR
ncbi:P-loop NTPase fold protein [Streptococcus agalactiae]|uniref:P-loop NTPase fold protein n=1 Tax=Streptococcus agalactiae TaxID=1311 RepID=UPI00178CF276|nr:P-loop NTPase fold protein [Streptococcus agalactiae]